MEPEAALPGRRRPLLLRMTPTSVASMSITSRAGAAPSSQARARAAARASRIASNSSSPMYATTRAAVAFDATLPNNAG